jgi:hypothetical protein
MNADTEQLMQELGQGTATLADAVGKEGVCVWWSIGAATDPEPLEALTKKWFSSKKFEPKLRSWNECLSRSLRTDYEAGKYLIQATKLDRTCDELAAVEVRQIIKGVQENELPRILRASIRGPENAYLGYLHQDGYSLPVVSADLTARIQDLRAAMPAESVGEWIIQLILDPLISGCRLNTGGKNYFVPTASLAKLYEMRYAVKYAAMDKVVRGSRNRITATEMRMNPDLLEDIVENVEDLVKSRLEAITEVATSGVGIRSLRARQKDAEQLLAYMEKYQQVLSKVDINRIEDQIAKTQAVLGIEVARAQGQKSADNGEEAMLDAMLGM